ncbi:MAG TPA: DNA translocase FtsK [Epulopiscium sp.]|nr:DNA translocase FtsK [Candidatus Epulonipiscium sp.]
MGKRPLTEKKKSSRNRTRKVKSPTGGALSQEIKGVLIFASAIIFGIGIYSHEAGFFGKIIYKFFVGILGIGAYFLPVLIGSIGILMMLKKLNTSNKLKMLISFGMVFLLSIFAHIMHGIDVALDGMNIWHRVRHYYDAGSWNNGGLIGAIFGKILVKTIGIYGSYVFIITFLIILLILLTGRSFIDDMISIYKWMGRCIAKIKEVLSNYQLEHEEKRMQKKTKSKNKNNVSLQNIKAEDPVTVHSDHESQEAKSSNEEAIEEIKVLDFAQKSEEKTKEKEIENISENTGSSAQEEPVEVISSVSKPVDYQFPSIELLQANTSSITSNSKKLMLNNAKKLEETLASFGVEAKVIQINRGPTVTRYELQPSQGVKVSKIVSLADDIALNLAAAGIRIEAPIPGKAAVGIEVPNQEVQPVFLREVIEDETFQKFPSKLAFALGKDIAGNCVVADIARMPHLLIAGATGSGKSVCINTLITSILYKANPNEVKLLMIDPKVVELSIYNGIPHLMIPVVTDPKKAAGALNWAVQEMTNRYKLFAENNVRDIKGYNNLKRNENPDDPNPPELMPQIVIIIDELADLMMTAPGEVEDAICRLAQMARAAGIHLVIATQRPSVDVITGVIKANIPSRLAFAVSSGTDSRTILDMVGAEKLLGKGDMLFYPVGAAKPVRIQGAFISDKEVERIVENIKQSGQAEYNQDMIEEITAVNNVSSSSGEEVDEYLQQAIEMVVEKEKASISMIQRYLRIGFNRAARIMEEMEERGIVGPDEGSKPRKVLITKEEFEQMKLGSDQKSSNF